MRSLPRSKHAMIVYFLYSAHPQHPHPSDNAEQDKNVK